ncbi:MAG TPA: glycosyltransferase family 39 protein, partial [Saprospiraceae bacterium]|nr:glycosyltransferase family 39 protein [Saprospiraceae bacterium]
MDVDASQYASISMEMVQGDSWLQVMHRMGHYLDKPPLLFWLSAYCFNLFGFSTWAYKLPSALAALLACWALYRFARLFYEPSVARHAAFILASSVGFLLLCNDVRTDTLLLAMTVCAVWQVAAYHLWRKWQHLAAAFFFIGLAMLAKGPIGLMLPAWAVAAHLLWTKDWKGLLDWRWLAGLLVTAAVLAPMCWGLWLQFDSHPERMVNGRTGVSGLYFFFWEQSFGRITGENVWKNDTGSLYFLHVYLWAFAPWAFVLAGLMWRWLRRPWGAKEAESAGFGDRLDWKEAFSIGGFFVSFVALSLSKYKLPHYIFVTLPWASVLVANGWPRLAAWFSKVRGAAVLLFYLPVALVFVTAFLLLGFVFPTHDMLLWLPPSGLLGWLSWRIARHPFSSDAEV